MARVARAQWLELGFWLALAVFAFAESFSFDQEIEIYRFGSSGWPRAVIVGIVAATVLQLVQILRESKKADPAAAADAAASDSGASPVDRSSAARLAVTLALPLVFAGLLDISGFYFTTPIFIACYLYLTGETRIKWLIVVPLAIYLVLVFFFTKLLYVGLPIGYVSPFYDFSNWLLVLIR